MKQLVTFMIILILVCPVIGAAHIHASHPVIHPPISTFSIVAYDPVYQEWGVAVQSKFLAVGAVVPYAAPNAGAIATQAWGNMIYGPEGLKQLAEGQAAKTVLAALTANDPASAYRQVGIVDSQGKAAAFTGTECQFWAGHKTGKNFTVQGNILTGKAVIDAMAQSFESSRGTLAERMLSALTAGQNAGGDSRGRQSAALLISRLKGGYSGYSDTAIDLRVDDHETPIMELKRLYRLHTGIFGIMSYMHSFEAFTTLQQTDTATRCLERALYLAERETDLAPATLNAVAWTLAESKTELKRALILAQRAVDGAPDDPNIIDTLATIHYQSGNLAQAIQLEEEAMALSPDKTIFKEKLTRWKAESKSSSTP